LSVTTIISKRKRIEKLVGKSITATAADDIRVSPPGFSIMGTVERFTEVWPEKYFDIADDRKITGLVLAYLVESAAIGVADLTEQGCALLKTAAAIDPREFRENMPRAFAQLTRMAHRFP